MANIKSATKRIRTNERNRKRNQAAKSALRTAVKGFRAAVAGKDVEAAKKGLASAQSVIDRSAKKGVIPKRTASRYKARLAQAHDRMRQAAGR